MKHIKKKFLVEIPLTPERKQNVERQFIKVDSASLKNDHALAEDQICVITTDYDTLITAMACRVDGQQYFIPLPDPVLIYFNSAQLHYSKIDEVRKIFLESFASGEATFPESIKQNFYNYFGRASGVVINLFTAIEAFINKSLPVDYVYTDRQQNRTITYNHSQIQAQVYFDVKLNKILPEIFGKKFSEDFQAQHKYILELKEMRDNIIHTRKDLRYRGYDKVFQDIINFKFTETIYAVRDFLNYYQPDYVEACDCGNDY